MKRADFIATVEQELGRMGFARSAYRWMPKGAGLVMIVNGQFRDLPVRCGMKKTELHRWLGRAAGWADMLSLVPSEVA
jgi:hypothetical protein